MPNRTCQNPVCGFPLIQETVKTITPLELFYCLSTKLFKPLHHVRKINFHVSVELIPFVYIGLM